MELTAQVKTNPCSISFKAGTWLWEKEYTKALLYNSPYTLNKLIWVYPDNPRTTHLQAQIPLYNQRLADLSNSIGVEYFSFTSQRPYSKLRPRGSPINSSKTRRGIISMWRMYLVPRETISLCGSLSDRPNWGNLCHMKSHTYLNHHKSTTLSLLPQHEYLMLPGL